MWTLLQQVSLQRWVCTESSEPLLNCSLHQLCPGIPFLKLAFVNVSHRDVARQLGDAGGVQRAAEAARVLFAAVKVASADGLQAQVTEQLRAHSAKAMQCLHMLCVSMPECARVLLSLDGRAVVHEGGWCTERKAISMWPCAAFSATQRRHPVSPYSGMCLCKNVCANGRSTAEWPCRGT